MTARKRRFGMHQNLLYDVILRQAGTLQKAILEGVMNAIDAGATSCEVSIDSHSFSIQDDGHGFQSLQEIEDYFDMFGTPHKEGDATYGRFRMGRGQLMAFGKNIWRSRTFEMQVDIRNRGIDYDFFERDEDFQGTRIEAELYDPIMPSDLERMKSELRSFVAWAQIPVIVNGEQVNQSPAAAKWDFEDDYAYYSLSAERHQLSVYNLGVLVNSFHAGRFGIGGTIVSKQQLEVNFARNDVQSTCPVFKHINARLKKHTSDGVKKKTKLTEAERDALVRDFLAGDMDMTSALKLRVLSDVTGRSWPIEKLIQLPQKFSNRLIVADRGDLMIETAQRRGITFSIDEATLERFGVTDAHQFVKRVAESCRKILDAGNPGESYTAKYNIRQIVRDLVDKTEIAERSELSQFVSSDHIALAPSEMTPDNTVILRAVEKGYSRLIQVLNAAGYEDRRFEERQIRIGKSDTALAWTDGRQTIWIDVEHARLLRRGMTGAYQIASTLLHEQLHEGPDTGTHQHDFAFYQAFHDMGALDNDPLGEAANRMLTTFIAKLQQQKRKVSKALLSRDDADLQLTAIRDEIAETADA